MLIAAAALAGCTGKKTADVQQETRVLTKTETAVAAPVQLAEEFTSEIEPYKENDITPAASGVHIDRILVEVGDPVRQGQLIVTLDPTQYTQQLVQLQDRRGRLQPPASGLRGGGNLGPADRAGQGPARRAARSGRQPQEEYRGPFAHYGRRHGPQLRVGRPVRRAAYPAHHADRSAEGRRQHFGAVFPAT